MHRVWWASHARMHYLLSVLLVAGMSVVLIVKNFLKGRVEVNLQM